MGLGNGEIRLPQEHVSRPVPFMLDPWFHKVIAVRPGSGAI